MKYLFINSVAGYGSTGRIAADQCRALMAQGHTCLLAYGRNKANCDDIETLAIGSATDVKLHGVLSRTLDEHGFGSKAATKAFLQRVKEYDPDVIWLHNIHGYYIHIGLLFDYLRNCGKKIYWTLHDCWSFTGHCAYFDYAGCDRWKTGCHDCPQKKQYPASVLADHSRKNYERKKQLFTGIPDLTLVTPSKWLAGLVKQSFLKEYPVDVIYNRIDMDVFKPTYGKFREQNGLTEKKMILGVASVWENRKGFRDFVQLAQLLDETYRVVLVGVSAEQAAQLPENVLPIQRTDSPQALAEIYTAADVLVNPTYEDNYPTVNLEALACGTPVITYRTGGSPESLDESCGAVIERSPQAIVEALEKMDYTHEACLRRAKFNNSREMIRFE